MRPGRRLALGLLDAAVYALAVTGLAFVAGTLLGFALGRGWVGTKYALFVLGFLMFGYATFALRPRAAWKDGDETAEESGVEVAVSRLLGGYALPREQRFPVGLKLFVASLLVLFASYLMERAGVVAEGGIGGF
ncbi:MAG: hypothetical protein ABEI39_06495 [Halobacteriales archaeon]